MSGVLIFAFDLVAIVVLAYGLYFRRYRRRDMALAYLGLNIGVMALTTVLATATVGAGLGIGLFGILSIIRLRSSEISHEEVAYYFAALTLGLLAGFQPDPVWIAPALSALVLVVTWVADHPRVHGRDRRQIVVLDAAYTDERVVKARLEELLHADVRHFVLTNVDLVRDLTVVDVRYRLTASDGVEDRDDVVSRARMPADPMERSGGVGSVR